MLFARDGVFLYALSDHRADHCFGDFHRHPDPGNTPKWLANSFPLKPRSMHISKLSVYAACNLLAKRREYPVVAQGSMATVPNCGQQAMCYAPCDCFSMGCNEIISLLFAAGCLLPAGKSGCGRVAAKTRKEDCAKRSAEGWNRRFREPNGVPLAGASCERYWQRWRRTHRRTPCR